MWLVFPGSHQPFWEETLHEYSGLVLVVYNFRFSNLERRYVSVVVSGSHVYGCFPQTSGAGIVEKLLPMCGFSLLDGSGPFPTFDAHLHKEGHCGWVFFPSICAAFLPSPARFIDLCLLYLDCWCEPTA